MGWQGSDHNPVGKWSGLISPRSLSMRSMLREAHGVADMDLWSEVDTLRATKHIYPVSHHAATKHKECVIEWFYGHPVRHKVNTGRPR